MLLTLATLVLVTGAEALHFRRVRQVSMLAFGPGGKPSWLGRGSPLLRVIGMAALVWGLATLWTLPPAAHRSNREGVVDPKERQHLLLVLDVSPSMRLQDAGATGKESRMARARAVLESVIARTAHDKLHTTVVAVYNGAKPVVEETRDLEVVENLMNDLPMHQAFPSGQTRIFDGLAEAARIAAKWPAGSATLMLISDGDTVPATGMPKMPPSIGGVLVAGVGDPLKGSFIDGRNSRQDGTTLRQIATRLGGEYFDGNAKLVPTAVLHRLGTVAMDGDSRLPGRRELALLLSCLGAGLLAGLPLLLDFFGSAWDPGPNRRRQSGNSRLPFSGSLRQTVP
ncbi:Ca-activated chloride channel family protein [Haloferula luteola]|uniref:Ca-activated chloride channel family protein n=1 Tax=Haloferula luteola TaxID=595692 RepID=A0A840VFW3_9BACT|nr:VWA domain-containing protein [Haloferula luteola]MBB5352709.1 Ca-activated chloride channel family protein [Haloferula luteola]